MRCSLDPAVGKTALHEQDADVAVAYCMLLVQHGSSTTRVLWELANCVGLSGVSSFVWRSPDTLFPKPGLALV